VGGFLLLPDDEVALVAHLLEAESLKRLAHDDLTFGPPLARALTAARVLPPDGPARFTFWAPQLGELEGGASLDYERSPILVWNRARWHASGGLSAGALKAQSRPRKDQPKPLLQLHERVERWMKREGVKLNRSVFALPHAAQWVREGGTLRSG